MRRGQILLWGLMGVAFLVLRPRVLGGQASYYIVHDEGLRPTLQPGDLAAFRQVDEYAAGDLVAVENGAVASLGRIVSAGPEGYLVQVVPEGPPPVMVGSGEIIGRLWFVVGGLDRIRAAPPT